MLFQGLWPCLEIGSGLEVLLRDSLLFRHIQSPYAVGNLEVLGPGNVVPCSVTFHTKYECLLLFRLRHCLSGSTLEKRKARCLLGEGMVLTQTMFEKLPRPDYLS